jgi:hypothetical protein
MINSRFPLSARQYGYCGNQVFNSESPIRWTADPYDFSYDLGEQVHTRHVLLYKFG